MVEAISMEIEDPERRIFPNHCAQQNSILFLEEVIRQAEVQHVKELRCFHGTADEFGAFVEDFFFYMREFIGCFV